jgi:hypothetical protein
MDLYDQEEKTSCFQALGSAVRFDQENMYVGAFLRLALLGHLSIFPQL